MSDPVTHSQAALGQPAQGQPAGGQGVAKICGVCGVDVSSRPRAKDARGRYVCKECLDRAQQATAAKARADAGVTAAAAAPKPASKAPVNLDDNSFILDLETKKIPEGKVACQSCGQAIPGDAVICTHCGFNPKTGEKLSVKVLKAQVIKTKDDARSYRGPVDRGPMIVGITLIVVLVGMQVMLLTNPPKDPSMLAIFAMIRWGVGALTLGIIIKECLDVGLIKLVLVLLVPFYDIWFALRHADSAYLKWFIACKYVLMLSSVFVALQKAGGLG